MGTKYNPTIHKRRSIRLKGYDYSQEGLYFITICLQNREYRFGRIEHDKMILNEFGMIAHTEWEKLPGRFKNFELDVFQIMPNHMHGIIFLKNVGAGFTPAPQRNANIKAGASPAPTVSDIVGAYKSLVANGCLEVYQSTNETMGKLWQRNFYEHIIRNQQSYETISNYIVNNPAKWRDDKFYAV